MACSLAAGLKEVTPTLGACLNWQPTGGFYSWVSGLVSNRLHLFMAQDSTKHKSCPVNIYCWKLTGHGSKVTSMATGCFLHLYNSLQSQLARLSLIITTHFLSLPLVLREGRKQHKTNCTANVFITKRRKGYRVTIDLSINKVSKPCPSAILLGCMRDHHTLLGLSELQIYHKANKTHSAVPLSLRRCCVQSTIQRRRIYELNL